VTGIEGKPQKDAILITYEASIERWIRRTGFDVAVHGR
jgi:hypothetical protein